MLGTVIQIDGYDPVTAAAVTLRAGSHDDAAVCHLDGQPWWPALTRLPTLRYDLFDGAFGGQITAPSSTLKMAVEPWPDFGRYALADARLRLWTGEVGAGWGTWTLRFDGRVSEQPDVEDGQADVSFAVDDRWLDTALLATYAGTTGAEGTAELKGQVKPLALGAPRYVAGVLIDAVNSVFQVSGYGAIQAFEVGLEKLVRFGAPVADYPTYAALVAAAVPAGRWATARAVGMARFGAPPAGQVSFLVSGDVAGPNGWARKTGQMIRRLALLSGGAGKIHDASLNALDVARPYNLSLYVDQQTTARQFIQQLAASVNAVAGMSWTGQLFVVPVAIGAAAVTLAADGSALPPVGKVKQIGIASPFKKLAIGAERAWTVHPLADVAFTAALVDAGVYAAATVYREGNLVSLADGSRWLYVATVAGSGVPPSDAVPNVWQNIQPRLTADNIAFDQTGDSVKDVVDQAILDGALTAQRFITYRLETDQILYKDGDTIRETLDEVGIKANAANTFVQDRQSVSSSGRAFASLIVQSAQGGTVAVYNEATGEIGTFKLSADVLEITDPNGGNPRKVIRYGTDNVLVIGADTVFEGALTVGGVKTDNLAQSAVQKTNYTLLQADVACPAGQNTLVMTVPFTKQEAGSNLRVQASCYLWGADDIQFNPSFVLDDGVAYSAGQQNMTFSESASAAKMSIAPALYIPGVAAGAHTLKFYVQNVESSGGDLLTAKINSFLEVIEVKKGAM